MRLLAAGAIALVLAGCASIGRPSGGAYDYDPPVFLGATPRVGATGVKSSRITLEFNENVQVQDAMNKVVVSPAQKSFPQVTANGRKLTVDIRDTIIPNTTYTIDFSDAVRDLNEGNVLDGLAIDFSTGDPIDSLRISGMVFEARTLEPAQGIIVGVYSNLADSAISTLQMERIAKTNQYGQFTIRGLKPQPYRLFAVNDINRDYHWDRSEDVAFYDTVVTPWCETVELTDTLLSSQGTDSLVSRTATVYKPTDLLLTWFNEGYTPQYLKDYSRPSRRRMLVKFSAKSDTLPTLRVVGGKMDGRVIDHTLATLNANVGNDSLEYFLRDSTLIASDTLMIAMTSLRTDTADRLVWGTDTLRFNFKAPKAPKKKKKKKDDEEEDSVPQLDFLNFSFKGGGKQSIYDVMRFSVDQPVDTFLPEGIHFEMLRDTIWDTIPSPVFATDTLGILSYKASAQWQPSTKYRLTIDSASIIGIYREWNRPFSAEFTTTAPEEYSALYFDVSGITDSAYIELLDRSDKVVAQAPLRGGVAVQWIMMVTIGVFRNMIFINSR